MVSVTKIGKLYIKYKSKSLQDKQLEQVENIATNNIDYINPAAERVLQLEEHS